MSIIELMEKAFLNGLVATGLTTEDEYRKLVNILFKCNTQYHSGEDTDIPDETYDRYYKMVKDYEAAHPKLIVANSPTQYVGSKVGVGQVKPHGFKMLSLSNCLDMSELKEWLLSIYHDPMFSEIKPSFVAEPKYDGCAITLDYNAGILEEARTRGDGEEGEVVTLQIQTVHNIPTQLLWELKGEIRGEVVLYKEDFERINANGGRVYANPRNAVAGLLRTQDLNRLQQTPLRFLQYSIHTKEVHDIPSVSETLRYLKSEGFTNALDVGFKSIMSKEIDSADDLIAWAEKTVSEYTASRESFPMQIDGIVFKVDDYPHQDMLGMNNREPRYATAYKFPPEQGYSYLESVDWQVGRTGALTPVANIRPIPLGGTIVSRVTLHNRKEIERLGICIGSRVEVVRSGDVIPKILSATTEIREGEDVTHGAHPIEIPSVCPCCKEQLDVEETELICHAYTGCSAVRLARLEYFVSRDGIDLKGFGPAVMKALYTSGEKISTVKEFLTYFLNHAKEDIIAQYPGIPGIEKLVDVFNARIASIPAIDFIAALGFHRVGHTVARKLIEEFNTLDDLMELGRLSDRMIKIRLCDIDGISAKIALSIRDFVQSPDVRAAYLMLKGSFTYPVIAGDALQGRTFVLTGKWSDISRDVAKEIISSNGGRIGSNPAKVTALIVGNGGNGTPAKIKKATEANVPVLSWSEFKINYTL